MSTRRVVPLMAALLLSACGGGGGGAEAPAPPTSVATPKEQLALTRFADCTALRDYYAEALTREFLSGFWAGIPCWSCPQPLVAVGAPSAAADGFAGGAPVAGGAPGASPGPSPGGALSVSDTNTQEAGVDEADVVEADASGRLYAIPGFGELLTLRGSPAEEAAVVSRTPFAGTWGSGLYLDGARLVVTGGSFGGGGIAFDGPASPVARYGSVVLDFYDLADPDHPQRALRYEIAGQPIDSRRIGSRIHVVSNFPLWPPKALAEDASFFELLYQQYWPALQRGDQAEVDRLAGEIRARVDAAVSAADMPELLPSWRLGAADAPAQTLACNDVLRPQVDERLGLVVISSIDSDGSDLAQVAAINNGWQVYASSANLYVTQPSAGWWFDSKQRQQTAIYRFALPASGAAQAAGHGVVDGWLLNRFTLSEHAGALRAAVTEDVVDEAQTWHRTNHLFVLGADLAVTGAVRDFIRDERIFSARFLGDRGFVVTFRQVDPLFAFDLSDPRNPQLRGELEVPGVSTYLHPYGADRLVTVGREAGTDGRFTGRVQLQMFDVEDLAQPRVVDVATIGDGAQGYAWSVAEYEPHAFTLARDLLSVPIQTGAWSADDAFSGFIAYRVSRDGFAELARVDHKEVRDDGGSPCPPVDPSTGAEACASFAPVVFNTPLRSVIVEEPGRDVLLTLSEAFLKATDLTAVPAASLATVPLRAAE